jgi:hypothetical protein
VRFASDIEATYTVMWERQRKGLTLESFSVEPRGSRRRRMLG